MSRTNHLKVLLTASVAALTALLLTMLATGTPSQAAGDTSVFSVLCFPSHRLPDDPIVYPGVPGAAHMHEFIGNPNTNANSTFDSMRAAQGSVRCETQSDTGGYWVPTLYKQGTRVPVRQAFFYYRGPQPGVAQIPKGLKMIAGGDTLNPPMPNLPQKSLSWSCVDTGPFFAQPPDCSKPGVNGVPTSATRGKDIRAHIHFPSCWDGVNVDSPDHRSHMQYRTPLEACPSSHPVRIPKITFHIVFASKNGTGTYLSSDHGAPGGTTLHGDFWNTWNQAVLQDAVTTCINGNLDCKRLKDNDPRLQ
jgi:Domain of unknown function (DUF1996)